MIPNRLRRLDPNRARVGHPPRCCSRRGGHMTWRCECGPVRTVAGRGVPSARRPARVRQAVGEYVALLALGTVNNRLTVSARTITPHLGPGKKLFTHDDGPWACGGPHDYATVDDVRAIVQILPPGSFELTLLSITNHPPMGRSGLEVAFADGAGGFQSCCARTCLVYKLDGGETLSCNNAPEFAENAQIRGYFSASLDSSAAISRSRPCAASW